MMTFDDKMASVLKIFGIEPNSHLGGNQNTNVSILKKNAAFARGT